MPEPEKHGEKDGEHYTDYDEITIFPVELRHIIEIHPINSGNESQWYEDGGNDREDHHNPVHLIGIDGELAIPDIGSELPVRIHHFAQSQQMIINVSKISLFMGIQPNPLRTQDPIE